MMKNRYSAWRKSKKYTKLQTLIIKPRMGLKKKKRNDAKKIGKKKARREYQRDKAMNK